MRKKSLFCIFIAAALLLSACGSSSGSNASDSSTLAAEDASTVDTADNAGSTSNEIDSASSDSGSSKDASEMFTDRDLTSTYDEDGAVYITLSKDGISSSSDSVQISGSTVTLLEEAVYIISGTLDDGMIIVNADKSDKLQLVLNNADISSSTSAAIYVLQADKVFITTAAGSVNTLSNGGEYVAIDENNIDAVIYSKEDLTLNGEGTLIINAAAGHGIVSKDDLKLTSGTYEISSKSNALSGKDSIRIADGVYNLTSEEDGIHSENDDDDALGYVYISGGEITINAADDGIHAGSAVTIDDGTIIIEDSYEGIEGATIDINGGSIDISSSDDGLNAAGGNDSSGFGGFGGDSFSSSSDYYINITGGYLHINASGDGIDSNGALTISGGEIYVSGPTNSANGALDYTTGGTITGGIVVMASMSGMEENFDSASTQGSIKTSVSSCDAGSEIILYDSDGNTLVSWQPDKSYSVVIVSCPDITEGASYTLSTGGSTTEITKSSLIYSSSSMGMNDMNAGRSNNMNDMQNSGGMRGGR